jgi:hypothetical protein
MNHGKIIYVTVEQTNKQTFGVGKVSPEKDDEFCFTNYQYLQVLLNLSDSDIAGLVQPTLDWIGIEKICVIGLVDAQEDLKQIRDMYVELVRFWDLDESLVKEFDGQIVILNLNHNVLTLRSL